MQADSSDPERPTPERPTPERPSAERPSAERVFRLRLLMITGVGALWRLGILVVDKWHQPLMLNDSLYYSAQAQQLADGIWFREIFVDRPGAEHGPLTSTVLALVSWVDDPVPWQRLVTVLCGIATVAVIGLLGRRVGGDRVGLAAAGIAAVYPNLWMNDGLVMSESISVLMVCLVLLSMLRLLDAPTGRGAAFVGLLAGLAALARSELALLTPAAMVLLLLVQRRVRDHRAWDRRGDPAPDQRAPWWRLVLPSFLLGLASLATVAPWVLFNLSRFSEPVTLTTNDGTTLLGSYCDTTFSGPEMGGWSIFCVTDDPAYSMDEEPSVRSARQREMAIQYAREHLDQLPKVVVARIARTLDLYGLDSLVAQDVGEERWRWASWAGIASWWVLAPAAAVGALRLRRAIRDRSDDGSDQATSEGTSEGSGASRWTLWVLGCPVASVFIITIVFYGAHRIRSSLEPTVVVLAAVTLVAVVDRVRGRSTRSADGSSAGSPFPPSI